MTTTKLYKYRNGNYNVEIFSDGSKIRYITKEPRPEYPESIDMKITNYCDAGCAFCHEMSTVEGLHGDLQLGIETLKGMPKGTEIAIGGGNPLSHPNLIEFLNKLKSMELIANMTVNTFHLNTFRDLILKIRCEKLIYGLGISYMPNKLDLYKDFIDSNTVFHIIVGVHKPEDVYKLVEKYKNVKILLLGYKTYGRGKLYYKSMPKVVEDRISSWYREIFKFTKVDGLTLSFDNLAIRQLNVRRLFHEDDWKVFYMGDDGKFTMYIDLVKAEYCTHSFSDTRWPLINVKEAFANLQISKLLD